MHIDKLVVLAQQGDEQALHDLIEEHLKIVERFAFQIGVPVNDVEDVTQEVFVRVYRFLEQYSGRTFTTWLYKITMNVARDLFKKVKREQTKMTKLQKQRVTEFVIQESDLFKSEEELALHDLVQKLDEKYKIPLVLFYFHNQKAKEIAQIMNIPLSTVKTRLARARLQLKQELDKKGDEAHHATT